MVHWFLSGMFLGWIFGYAGGYVAGIFNKRAQK